MNSASRPREGAIRVLLALWLAVVVLLPTAQPVWAAQPVSLPQNPAAQAGIEPAAPGAKTVVEHWIGTGYERDEAKQGVHNSIGDCWFCSFGVLERHFKVDLLVYDDGTLSGTITEDLNLSYELTQNVCYARTGQIITGRILNCTLVYPNPSATQVWQVKGLRTSEGDGRQYIEFESADTSQEYNFGGIVTGCEEHWDGSCRPYYFAGEGLDVGLRDFDTLFPPSEKFVIDTTAYGRPAVVYDYHIETLNGYARDGYHKYDYSWRLFEVGTRPILDLDQELLERSVFMNSVPLSNLFQAKVNWSAVGGGSTKWQVDASSEDTPVSPTTLIPRTFDVGALPVGSHPLRVDGRDTLGRNTNQENSDLVIAPLIKLCKELGYSVVKMGATANYKCSFRLPDPALEAEIKKMPDWFPYLGGQPFGIKETQVGIDLEVKSTGEGAIKGFGQTGFGAMGGSVIGSLAVAGDVVLLPSGAKIPSGSMDVTLAGKLTKEQPLVAVVPQFAAAVTAVGKISPAAGAYLKDLAKLALEFEPKMVASPKFKNEDGGDVEWQNEEVTVGAGLKVVLSLTVIEDLVKLEASLGGEAQIVWILPPNPNYFKSVDAKIAATYKVQYWKFMIEGEKAYAWSYTGPPAVSAAAAGTAAPAEPLADPTWTLIDRAYVSQPDYAKWVGKAFTETVPADFALMTNAGPLVAPVLVEDWDTSTLIWSQERPGLAALGSDELAFARGTVDDWSAPAAYLTNDSVADWNPQAIARNGGTLLVWQRMDTASPGDINTNGAAFLGHTQIATAFLDENATSLTPIQMLTTGTLNHRPQLAPTNEGAMAVWVNNPANALVGDTTHRDALMFARYNQADETWSTPAVAVPNVPGLLDYAFAAYGSQAAVLFLTDTDGNAATTADIELYAARYQSGAWGAPVRITTNSVAESSPEFAFVNGAPRGVWQAGNQLFFLSDWAAAPTALPFAAAPLAGNFRLVVLEDGDLTLLWTEPESGGQQLYRALFTKAASAWSLPQPVDLANLGGTPAGQGVIESLDANGTSLYLDGASGMMIAYTEAAAGTTTRTLPAFNGATNPNTPIPQMPVLGKRTLRLAYVPLETNLRIVPADIVVTPATQQVGGMVTVSAIVRNTGLYSVQSVTATLASFAVSNPAAITPLGTQMIPLLAGGGSSTLHFTFPRPAATDRLYVVTVGTPDGANVEESTYGDNTAYVGTDALVVGTGPTAYAGRVASPMVVLRQQSALPVPVSMEVGIRLGRLDGPIVGGATAVLPVAAGQPVTVTVPVSAAALGAGRHTVYVDVDPEGMGGDWNPSNDIAGTTIVVQPDLTTMTLLAQQSGSTFRVWVTNEGNWPSPATTFAVYDRPHRLPGAVQIAAGAIPALQPGQTVKVEGTLGAAAQTADVTALSAYAVLDPANTVAEINENNNTFLLDVADGVTTPPPGNGPKIYLPIVER